MKRLILGTAAALTLATMPVSGFAAFDLDAAETAGIQAAAPVLLLARGGDDNGNDDRGRGRGGDDDNDDRGRGRGGDDDNDDRGRGRGGDDSNDDRGRGRGSDDAPDARPDRSLDDTPDSGSNRSRPRVPGGSGCDDPGDVAEHAECRG